MVSIMFILYFLPNVTVRRDIYVESVDNTHTNKKEDMLIP